MEFVYWATGVIVGFVLTYIFYKPVGTLMIDHSNPAKDVYRFAIDNLDGLSKKKRIVLKVDNNADLSR